jgi:hypothetical protein
VVKESFAGNVVAVQPRIRLHRSFDQRHHSYQGYILRVDGVLAGMSRPFVVAIGEAAQAKNTVYAGCKVSSEGEPIQDSRTEVANLYKVAKLQVVSRGPETAPPPPFLGAPPALEVYRSRGHRRLDAKTFRNKCLTCLWACEMAVEITPDHWKPHIVKWRHETFCYGPKSCKFYRAGPTRKVPGRNGMTWEEEDWVDEEMTAHRADDA